MDELDREIEGARRRRDDTKRLLEQLEIEVRILERAASLRPAAGKEQDTEPSPRRGGKPPGAIGMAWRKVLAAIDANDALEVPLYAEAFFAEAVRQGMQTSLASVRERLKFFESQGYVSGNQLMGYTVTEHAREKLGLDKLEGASPDISEEAP